MSPSILIIAPESAALPVAAALRVDLHAEVETAPNRRAALTSLRRRQFALVLIDENLTAGDPTAADLLYQNSGAALIVELNFSISSAARIVRQTRAALVRRTQDCTQARTAATSTLHGELNASLAGILLESEMALREASPTQSPRLRHLVQLAGDLRDLLRA
jgi:hypothetical protein